MPGIMVVLLVIVGVYVFMDDIRRKARSVVKVRKARPSSRKAPVKGSTKGQTAKQRGKAGRSKKRKRHR